MAKLIKYEIRKTWFPKLVILFITAVAEILFLAGCFADKPGLTSGGSILLFFVATTGILIVGLYSLIVLYRDLNTKQGYMLFMTPNSCYRILGAKILENGISILLAGVFFAILAWIDLSLLFNRYNEGRSILEMIQMFLNELPVRVEFSFKGIMMVFFSFLISWLASIVAASFAIVLSSTLLTGKKLNILLSLCIYIGVNFVITYAAEKVPYFDAVGYYLVHSLIELGFAVVIYILSCRIMEKKLSL